jgi:hypothetical protein
VTSRFRGTSAFLQVAVFQRLVEHSDRSGKWRSVIDQNLGRHRSELVVVIKLKPLVAMSRCAQRSVRSCNHRSLQEHNLHHMLPKRLPSQRQSRSNFFERETRAATAVQNSTRHPTARQRSENRPKSLTPICPRCPMATPKRPRNRSNVREPGESTLVGEKREQGAPLILFSDRNSLSTKLATKHVGMQWIGKAPNHVIPHSWLLPRQLIRPVRQRTRAAKLVHTVDHWTDCARRNTD